MAKEFSRGSRQLTNCQHNRRSKPLYRHQQQQSPQPQKAKKIPIPSPGSISVIGVEILDIGPLNVLKGSKSTLLIMEMKTKESWSKTQVILTLLKNMETCSLCFQKLLYNQKVSDTTQRHQIFYSKCLVKDKICNLIIDNKNCENILFRALLNHLELEMMPHHPPYTIGWIKKGPCIKVIDLCHVPIFIGEF